MSGATAKSSGNGRCRLPLAAKPDCIFLPVAQAALEGAGISWETPYQANDWRDLVAFVSASLAVETNMP